MADCGNGNFTPIAEDLFEKQINKLNPMVFKTGEILEIRGSRFRVESIQRKKMILKLLPQLKDKEVIPEPRP